MISCITNLLYAERLHYLEYEHVGDMIMGFKFVTEIKDCTVSSSHKMQLSNILTAILGEQDVMWGKPM